MMVARSRSIVPTRGGVVSPVDSRSLQARNRTATVGCRPASIAGTPPSQITSGTVAAGSISATTRRRVVSFAVTSAAGRSSRIM